MTTHDTPEAALAAALHRTGDDQGWCNPWAVEPNHTTIHEEQAATILAALDGWTLVNDEDFHAELTDDELATCAAMNFGAGLAEGRKEAEATIARLRAALERLVSVYERPAGRGKAVEHLIDEGHEIGEPCFICAALEPSEP